MASLIGRSAGADLSAARSWIFVRQAAEAEPVLLRAVLAADLALLGERARAAVIIPHAHALLHAPYAITTKTEKWHPG